MPSKKKSSLVGYSNKKAEAPEPTTNGKARVRGTSDQVALNFRLMRDDWMRLHNLALTKGKSLQTFFLEGISAVFAAEGLEPVKDYAGNLVEAPKS